MSLPPLRHIEPFPIDHEGAPYVVLHDPEGYVEQELLVSAPAFFIAIHLDGVNDIAAIRAAFFRQYGVEAGDAEIQGVVDHLDRAGYLVSSPFLARKAHVDGAFRARDSRPAYLAGRSYPADPGDLRAMIDGFFTRVGGPGERPGATTIEGPCLPCLIVPHIDFERGGHVYAHGYLELVRHRKPDTVLLFGVAHCGVPAPFVLTRKGFETPLGVLLADLEAVEFLAASCDWDPFAYEIAHRTEHSLEFQAVMLAYLYGPSVRIVPILCSAMTDDPGLTQPTSLAHVTRFLDACRQLVAQAPEHTTVIAGADLAHVGARFGDEFDVDDTIIRGVSERDREDLGHVLARKPESFYASVMRDENARRVCGLNCIYAAVHAAANELGAGSLLHYDYAHDPAGGIVSFAAVGFSPYGG